MIRDLIRRDEEAKEAEAQWLHYECHMDVLADRDGEEAQERFDEFLEALAHCGPGEEPDMDKWRRQVAEHQEAERKRRQRRERARQRWEEVLVIPYEPNNV